MKKNKPKIYNRRRRLNNLYKVIDKDARSVVFRMNKAQEKLYDIEKENKRIIVLKARQLGMTTYKCISWIDRCLFYWNQNIIITAHKQEKQKEIFTKVKYAFEQIPAEILLSDWTVRQKPIPKYDSVNELYFPNNNSRIKVSLDSRSWTATSIHITELAFRSDARSMMTWTLPSLPQEAPITIETTANWVWNYFYELRKKSEDTLSFYTFFLPRYEEEAYFSKNKLEVLPEPIAHINNLQISEGQKQRYKEQYDLLWREVFQEYPSFPEEAFLATWDCVFDVAKLKALDELKYTTHSRYKKLRIYKKYSWHCYFWVDTAWWSIEWDYSTISIRNANLELIAAYYWHIEPDNLCDVIDVLVKMWYRGTIWIERNNTWIATISNAKKYSRYHMLYREKTVDKITNKKTKKYWRVTTSKTRPLMIAAYEEAIRNEKIIDMDERFKKECFTFYYNEKNRPEAISWSHDDWIIADAICVQMLQQPKYIELM